MLHIEINTIRQLVADTVVGIPVLSMRLGVQFKLSKEKYLYIFGVLYITTNTKLKYYESMDVFIAKRQIYNKINSIIDDYSTRSVNCVLDMLEDEY